VYCSLNVISLTKGGSDDWDMKEEEGERIAMRTKLMSKERK